MQKRISSLLSVLVLATMFATPAAAAPKFSALQPGETVTREVDVPINLVFVGYDMATIDEAELLGGLPETYKPSVRAALGYGLPGRDLGLNYTFDYNIVDASRAYENKFFNFLKSSGEPGPLTAFQSAYNDQDGTLDVEGQVLYVNAPAAEKALSTNARDMLGLDIEKSYTIFFINWYSRPDFRFHVYTKTSQPDPDTGYNFGEERDSRKMIAWGGTTYRTWFFDPSAGPESWSGSYDITSPDIDGDGLEDYRIPPIWEYAAGGYRDPSELSSDLALITRFVGINLLFTTSPLYDPVVATPGRNGKKVVNIEVFEDDPSSSGLDFIKADRVERRLRELQPYHRWRVVVDDNQIDEGALNAVTTYGFADIASPGCWESYGTPFAQPFCYFDANYNDYVPEYGEKDYVIPVFAFNLRDENVGPYTPLGFADDNWIDGTQSFVFAFDSPGIRESGYGFSTTFIHEVGHHVGLSHPHDGYDPTLDIDYGPEGDFFFAWSGDENESIMTYIDVNEGFSTFDKDNIQRLDTAGYLNLANELLGRILESGNTSKVDSYLRSAERDAAGSLREFDRWNYRLAAEQAYRAYTTLTIAAEKLGVIEGPSSAPMDTRVAPIPRSEPIPGTVDPIRPKRFSGE